MERLHHNTATAHALPAVLVGVIQLAVLVVMSALGVFKPWGKTPLGRRRP